MVKGLTKAYDTSSCCNLVKIKAESGSGTVSIVIPSKPLLRREGSGRAAQSVAFLATQ